MNADKPADLFGFQTANCLRAAIALEEAGIAYRARSIDLTIGEHRRRTFLELNPAGQVPVLVDHAHGEPLVLTQSNAIVFHAAARAGDKLISEGDQRASALTHERYFYFLTDVIAVDHAIFHLGPMSDTTPHRMLRARALDALSSAERFVSSSRYMAGERFSIADIAALTITHTLSRHLDWDKLPALKRWFTEVIARPSVVRGFGAFARAPG